MDFFFFFKFLSRKRTLIIKFRVDFNNVFLLISFRLLQKHTKKIIMLCLKEFLRTSNQIPIIDSSIKSNNITCLSVCLILIAGYQVMILITSRMASQWNPIKLLNLLVLHSAVKLHNIYIVEESSYVASLNIMNIYTFHVLN